MEVGVYMVLSKMGEVVKEKEFVVDNKSVLGSKTNTKKLLPIVFVTSQPDSQIICKSSTCTN